MEARKIYFYVFLLFAKIEHSKKQRRENRKLLSVAIELGVLTNVIAVTWRQKIRKNLHLFQY